MSTVAPPSASKSNMTAPKPLPTGSRDFNLASGDLYRHDGPINLTRLMPLALSIDRPDLRDKRFTPATVVSLNEEADIFWHIRKSDILLQHPYDSFQTVLDFLGQAAEDPHTLAIKQTLYRHQFRLATSRLSDPGRPKRKAGHRHHRTEGPV